MAAASIDEYLSGISEEQRRVLEDLRATLRALLPDGVECMSYSMPCIKVSGKAIAGYAAFAKHNSYFPHSGQVLPAVSDRLGSYDWSTGTLRFGRAERLPADLVELLVDTRLRQLGL